MREPHSYTFPMPVATASTPEARGAEGNSNPGRSGSSAGRSARSTAVVLLLISLVATLTVKLWRGSLESTIWMDEVFSLELATKGLPELVDLAEQDVHPPLYYVSLHFWLGTWEAIGVEPSILLARSLNIFSWAVLVVGAFLAMKKLSSISEAVLGAALVGILPGAVQLTQDARSYGMALLGTTIAFLVLILDLTATDRTRRSRGILWTVFALASLLATSCHHLSWLALIAMMLGWLVSSLILDGFHPRALLAPILASVAVAAFSTPWLLDLSRQTRSLTEAAPTWMTPPTAGNLVRVFAVWLPLGRDGGSLLAAFPWLWLLVVCCWASIPVLALGLHRNRNRRLFVAGIAGLSVALVFIGSLWSLSRYGHIPVFHGPRYPLLVSGIWATAIWLLAASAPRIGATPRSAIPWLATLPWIVCGLTSLSLTVQLEARSSGSIKSAVASEVSLRSGLYFSPKELEPFFRSTLRATNAVPIPESPCESTGPDSLDILILNRWRGLDTPESLLFHSALQQGQLGSTSRAPIPAETNDFEMIHMADGSWRARFVETVCPALTRLRNGDDAPGSAMSANLGAQRFGDGWSYLEFDRKLRPFRWTNRRAAVLRLRGPLSAGRHQLILTGRLMVGERLDVSIPSAGFKASVDIPDRDFDISIPFDASGATAPETLVGLESPVQVIEPSTSRSYSRTLSILIRRAEVQPGS